MIAPRRETLHGAPRRDAGVSLVEILVAIGLFSVLGTLLLGVALSTAKVTDNTRQVANIGEESRAGMERMTRELRQTAKLTSVHLPAATNDSTQFTLWADFNGNKCIDASGVDPEQLTYVWNPVTKRLTLTATVLTDTYTERLLAATVSSFTLSLNSSAWQYDKDQDGVTSWQEVNASSIGDGNATNFSDAELERIDLIQLDLTATDGTHSFRYRTRVNLRNQNQDVEIRLC
jgi:type II secretory pathway pseudopilin PulG